MISKTVLRWLTLAALVGLCFGVMVPGASADTEITACPTTITAAGNFFLKTNLTSSGDCIIVHHRNVAIDMKGHTITGNGTGGGITDTGTFVESVAISNGKIRNFDVGIDFSGSASDLITLEGVDSSSNKDVGIFIEGCCNSITEVKANDNGDGGIDVEDCCNLFNQIQVNDDAGFDGLFVDGCCNTANQITANGDGDDGIDVRFCCTGISNSQANDNKDNGIFMTNGDNIVSNVKTLGNASAGIDSTGDDDLIANVTANNNGSDGMEFEGDDDDVAESTANSNKSVGIDLHFGVFNTVTEVTANHNVTGVVLSCGSSEGNAVLVSAHNNSTANLTETGTCTNLNNNAP
jgi:hypothetical protein